MVIVTFHQLTYYFLIIFSYLLEEYLFLLRNFLIQCMSNTSNNDLTHVYTLTKLYLDFLTLERYSPKDQIISINRKFLIETCSKSLDINEKNWRKFIYNRRKLAISYRESSVLRQYLRRSLFQEKWYAFSNMKEGI